ncbi:mediator of DNA damage checkpoint protein 1-like isoform X3 [Palaemon carinicauda]
MDDEGFLECTQALPDDWDADSDGEPGDQPELVAWLEVGDKKYEVFEGQTKIGRDPETCAIVLSQKVLSKEHAAIEVTSDVHTLVDLGSMNKTRIGKMALKPHIRYALQGGEKIRFGDVPAKYTIKPKAPCEDSGSETGSESMLQLEDSEERASPVLTHKLPGLDTSSFTTNEPSTSAHNTENTLNDSVIVPGTQESKKKLSGTLSPSLCHKTLIPESPSISQSTPLQGKRVSSVLKTPGNTSAIQDVTADNDSFFFEPSQPKCKEPEERLNATTKNKVEVDYNSDASTDNDEDIATQLFEDTADKGASAVNEPCPLEEDGCDDDICLQPTQLFTGAGHQTDKDNADDTQDVLDAFDDSIEKPSLSITKDDDDDYVPTQLFFDDEKDPVFKRPKTLAPKGKKRISGGQKFSKVDDDLFEDYLLAPTQPYGECSKTKQTVTDEDAVYDVPTQLFSAETVGKNDNLKEREDMEKSACDDDTDDMFNQPTQLFSSDRKSTDGLKSLEKSSKIAERDQNGNSDNIDNRPTQPYMGDKDDFFDGPTQVYGEESLDSNQKLAGNLVQETSKNRSEVRESPVHCQDRVETPKDQIDFEKDDDDDEDLLPTQLFDPYKSNKESPKVVDGGDDDDLLATQLFDPSENSTKILKSNEKASKMSRLKCAVFQTPSKGNDGSDEDMTPTQVYKPRKSGAKTPKRLVDTEDDLPPTQLFEGPCTPKETADLVDDDNLTPTQYFSHGDITPKTSKRILNDDSLPPTQLYSTVSTVNTPVKEISVHELSANQLYSDSNSTSDSSKQLLKRDHTTSFTIQQKACKSSEDVDDDDDDLLPTQLYADTNKTATSPSKDESISEAPTQPYNNDSGTESNIKQRSSNVEESERTQTIEKEPVENVDEDATQDIAFDTVIGVDKITHVLEQTPGKTEERNDVAWENASDVDSDASETLLNSDALNKEENTNNSDMELTRVQENTLIAIDENGKEECAIENYHSDESTDVEEEHSTIPNVQKNSTQFSDRKLNQGGDISTEVSSSKVKLSLETKVNTPPAEVVGDFRKVQSPSIPQSTPEVCMLQDDISDDYGETEDMLALSISLVDTQNETPVMERSVFRNTNDLDVKEKRSKSAYFSLSSDSDSEEESFGVSQKIFDLTPFKSVNALSSSSENVQTESVASRGKSKRKLTRSKESSENGHSYSGIEESPKKKKCNRTSKKNENELGKLENTRSKNLDTKKKEDIPVLENEKAGPSGVGRSPDKHQQCSKLQRTTDKAGNDGDQDNRSKRSNRKTRKRTQDSLEDFATNNKSDDSKSKTPKLEVSHKAELCLTSSERSKSDGLQPSGPNSKNQEKESANQTLPKRSRLSATRNMKREEMLKSQVDDSECDSLQGNSSVEACREGISVNTREAQKSNLANSSGKRNTRQRTENPAFVTQNVISEKEADKRIDMKKDCLQPPKNLKEGESSENISQEKNEVLPVHRKRGRGRVTHEVKILNSKEDYGKDARCIVSSENQENPSEKPQVPQEKIDPIEEVKKSSKLCSERKYRGKRSVANESSEAVQEISRVKEEDKVDLELKNQQITETGARSSLSVDKKSVERTDEMIDEDSGSTSKQLKRKVVTRGQKNPKNTIAIKSEIPKLDNSIEAVTKNDEKAGSKNQSDVRTSRRSRRGPDRYSPERDSQKMLSKKEEKELPKGTYSGSQNSEDAESSKGLVADIDKEDSTSSGNFAVPALRKGRRTKKSQDGINEAIDIIKEVNVTEQPKTHAHGRRGRASIATSQPSSVKSLPKTRQRLSAIPEITNNTRKQNVKHSKTVEENTESKELQLHDEQSLSLSSKRGTKKDTNRGTSGNLLAENEDSQKRKRRKRLSEADRGDSEDCVERRGASTECSEVDSEDSQVSVKRRGRKSTSVGKLPSTPKCSLKQQSSACDKTLWSPSQRQLQASNRPRVLFTGYKDVQDEKIVLDLGGKVVESAQECTVLVTTAVKRTCKLLAVMGRGMPIVSPLWLNASKQARNFTDPWEFLVKDRESEVKFGFRLDQSLRSASKYQLFEGLEIHATKSVKPSPEQMKEIVECSGGQYLDMPPKRYAPQIRIVSCPEDKGQWTSFQRIGIPVLGTEFILTGLLRHQLLLDEFVLT